MSCESGSIFQKDFSTCKISMVLIGFSLEIFDDG